VLDEPTTNLDLRTRARLEERLLRARAQHGCAALIVSHDLRWVARVADRLLVVQSGSIVEVGRPGELLSAPAHPYTRSLVASLGVLPETGATHE
jgi:ABC-type glutathione transport system ATPase component